MDGDTKAADHEPREEAGWQYKSDNPASGFAQPFEDRAGGSPADSASVEWSASEFVAHEKSTGWYLGLMLGTALISAVLYLVTRDLLAVVVILVMATILAAVGARKPRTIIYRLDQSGLTVGGKFYPYKAFKSFAMPEDGPFSSIVLVPLKRFDFPVSAYLAPDSQQKALEVISSHLPMERGELDTVEQLMRQLRF